MVPLHFRTTQNVSVDSTINNIHRNSASVQRLQLQQATGKKINAISDDPLGARRALPDDDRPDVHRPLASGWSTRTIRPTGS